MNRCYDHSQHVDRITKLETGQQTIWKAIDQMRAWVIAGMAAIILEVCSQGIEAIFHHDSAEKPAVSILKH